MNIDLTSGNTPVSGTPPLLNSSKHLSKEEKDAIRAYLLAAENEEERNVRKLEIMQEYTITEGVINALFAWVKIYSQKSSGSSEVVERVAPVVLEALSTVHPTAEKPFDIKNPTRKQKLVEEFRETLLEEPEGLLDHIETEAERYGVSKGAMELFVKQNIRGVHTIIEREKKRIEEADKREFSDAEKKHIREYISIGKTDEEKRIRRRELAHAFGVSMNRIGSLGAWTKIWESKGKGEVGEVVKETGVGVAEVMGKAEEVRPDPVESRAVDGEEIVGETFAGGTIAGKVTNTKSETPLDEGFIRDLAEEYDLSDPEDKAAFLSYVYDCFDDVTLEDIQRILPDFIVLKTQDTEARAGEGMGALANYNNAIKNEWRKKLQEFIHENTDAEKRKDMKVLCLPGIECLEIPLYLELGFRAENIVGVESGDVDPKNVKPEMLARLQREAVRFGIPFVQDKKTFRKILLAIFRENAERFGIQTRIGKLEKFLETEETVFDVVSLDFLGGWSAYYSNILQKLNLGNSSVVLTNFLGRRDSRLRESWFDFEKQQNPKIIFDVSKVSALNGGDSESIRQQMNIYLSGKNKLSTLREDGLSSLIAGSLAGGLNKEGYFYQKIQYLFDRYRCDGQGSTATELAILAYLSTGFAPWVYSIMKKAYGNQTLADVESTYRILLILFQYLTSKRVIHETASGKYKTDKGTPMFFDFFKLEKLKDDYSFMKPFIRFATAAIQVLCDSLNSNEYSITLERAHKDGFTKRDVLEIRKGGIITGSIKFSELFNNYMSYKEVYNIQPTVVKGKIRVEMT